MLEAHKGGNKDIERSSAGLDQKAASELQGVQDEPVIGKWVEHGGNYHFRFHSPGKALSGHSFSHPELVAQGENVALVASLPDFFTKGVIDPKTGEPIITFRGTDVVLGLEEDGVIVSKGLGAERISPDGTREQVEGYYDAGRRQWIHTSTNVALDKEKLAGGMKIEAVQEMLGLETPPKLAFQDVIEQRRATYDPNDPGRAIEALKAYEEAEDVRKDRFADKERIEDARRSRQSQVAGSVVRTLRFVEGDVPTSPEEAAAQAELIKSLALEAQTRGVLPDLEDEAYYRERYGENFYKPNASVDAVDLEVAEIVMYKNTGLTDEDRQGLEKARQYLHERMAAARDGKSVPPRKVDVWGIGATAEAIESQVEQGKVARESSRYALQHGDVGTVAPLAKEHGARWLDKWRKGSDTDAPKPIEPPRPRTVGEAWAAKMAKEAEKEQQ